MMNVWLILALTVKSKLGYNKAGTTAKKFLLEEADIYFPPKKNIFVSTPISEIVFQYAAHFF